MRSQAEKNVADFAAASQKPIEDLTAQLATLKRDIQNLSTQIVDFVGREKGSMSSSARKMAADMSATLDSYGIKTDVLASELKARTNDVRDMIAKEVRANPLRAVVITVGIGLILGALSRGK
jgi:ElaB/YqjD/DUF883 family membrane-anchored ribosome-binding protein